jgi:hypothetical protein
VSADSRAAGGSACSFCLPCSCSTGAAPS